VLHGSVTLASADDNLNWADGVFKHLADAVALNTIGAITNSNQGVQLTNQQSYELLQDVVKAAPAALKTYPMSDKIIHVSGLLWDQIVEYLEDNAVTSGFIKIFETGAANGLTATYKGIPVKVHYEWDEISQEYFGLTEQNKIVYTVKGNMVMGTDLRASAAGSKALFKIWQNPETDEITIRSKFVFNTNIVWPELFSVGL
jgi:hypothetical protein